jgi:hypothetical protein
MFGQARIAVRRRLGSALIATVFAASGLVASPGIAAAAPYGSCVTGGIANYFSFVEKASGSNNLRNIKSTIQVSSPTSQFRPCSWNLGNDGSSGWVAIVPGSGNPQLGNSEAILQIGLIACNEFWLGACSGNSLRYFWAEGGCGASIPDPQDLGSTGTTSHVYEIRHFSDHWYNLKIGGVTKIAFLDTSHDDVSCWITKNFTKGQWAFERWDRGDGIGDTAHNSLMWYANYMWDPGDSGTWTVPNFTSCSASPGTFPGKGFCSWGADALLGWSQY